MREQLVLQTLLHFLELGIECGMEDDSPGHVAIMDLTAYGVKAIFRRGAAMSGDERHNFSTVAAAGSENRPPTC